MRNTKTVTITAEGRDAGSVFLLTEMPASVAERWATRALMGMVRANVDVPDGVQRLGMAGIAMFGFKALLSMPFDVAEPLLDEMFACVQRIPKPEQPNVVRGLIEDDIQEVATRAFLRSEVFELHTGFSVAGALSQAMQPSATGKPTTTTPTSPPPSA